MIGFRAGLLAAIIGAALDRGAGGDASGEWPMLGHDPGRSGATADEVRPPFERKWYRLFPDEGLMAGVQAVVSGGKVFIGTLRGIVHAIDAGTGRDLWTFRAPASVLHACAAGEGKVFFGCADGRIYALDAGSGLLSWSVPTGAAVWNAPLIHGGLVLIGSRDGKLYALAAATGEVRWAQPAGGPLLSSPALDVRSGRAYAASEDMRVRAFAIDDGRLLWTSEPLPGVTFRGYHPVIAPDGSVMVTTAPAISLDALQALLLDMAREIFGDFASWRHDKKENARLRAENFKLLERAETYPAQLEYLRRRLAAEPAYQTFFVLDPETGKQKFVAPIVYSESMNGTGAPPVVTPPGIEPRRVIVKFQALLRSRYEHYSPFLNAGALDTASGNIEPLLDESRTYGWHDSLLLVHDEQCQLAVGGRVLINTHQDNVNAIDLSTREGYREPFCYGIHEPARGEAAAIWCRLLAGEPLPPGKEWLQRGTAVYGGGSVIDTAVSIAGDSFYYIPAHEINSGAALIAYRMDAAGTSGSKPPPLAGAVDAGCWKLIRELPWDWDILEMPRLRPLLDSLPDRIPGTRSRPLAEAATARAAAIADAEIDRFIREEPVLSAGAGDAPRGLADRLAAAVRELVSRDWRPLLFPAGKHPAEVYRFFADPADTLEALALAYNFLEPDLQEEVATYVKHISYYNNSSASSSGSPARPAGDLRSAYREPPPGLARIRDDLRRGELGRLYPLWLWAHTSGDWEMVEKAWPSQRGLLDQPLPRPSEDCGNSVTAGLIAGWRIARRLGDREAAAQGLVKARAAIRERIAYELAHPRGGLIREAPVLRTILGRWRHLTPEVGRLLAAYARDENRRLMEVSIDHHRPAWWIAWGVETLWRNECPFEFPTVSVEVLDARAFILEEPAEKLESFIDIPWCRADVFHARKLALCLRARSRLRWEAGE